MTLQKIKEKKAHIGIIGLGYVGLPLAIEFCKTGFQVTGLDIDQEKIDLLSRGKSYINHISGANIKHLNQECKFKGTTNFTLISNLDCILICVPTPLSKNREPDMSYIIATAQKISPHLVKNQLIVLESTTFPGTTQEVLIPALEAGSELKANKDFFIAYSPEREDPNNKEYFIATTPKVIGADNPKSLELANAIYSSIVNKTVLVSGTKVAEATKLTENVFRAVNIALVNELKVIYEKMGIDIWEVIEACSTKPFGFMPFYPGPGLGGHCIPIDPFYLTWKAREHGITTRFIELAGEINTLMPDYVIQKIIFALNREGKSLKNSRILLLGLAYKKNVDDTRESVTFKIMELLEEKGAVTDYNDPYIPIIKSTRKYKKFTGKKSIPLKKINEYDCVVILTDHTFYDFKAIEEHSSIIVDTRNACGKIKSDKVIKA
ncbi:MAG: nucleotide sugar dehydrogenase [Nitrospina sp.]|nr:nucleotide sugar dehydrogenase [Nitrospina sp.]MBT6295715.1 nucleotide sugar dehydrogenase [Nitrospina sp.]MBT7521531.1 nucleotide sugar dehydrogenase [Nitrospina sp.]